MKKITKILLTFEIITLTLLIILSFFAYPQADDFIFANSLRKFGWLGSQINWYKTWFGRFSSTMLLISAGYTDLPILYKLFPTVTFFGYIFAFYLISGKLLPNASKHFKFVSALTIFLLYISGMPSLSQEIYWFTGWATYAPAQIFLLIMFSYIYDYDSKLNKYSRFVLLALSGFFVIGSNEVSMLFLMVFLFIALLKDFKNKKLWLMFAIFLLFSLVVILAPGNAIRAAQEHDFLFSTVASLGLTVTLIGIWLLNPLLWITAFMFCHFRQKLNIKIVLPKGKPVFVIPFLLFLIFCAPFTHFWSTGVPAPGRTLNISFLVFIFLFAYTVSLAKTHAVMVKILSKKSLIFSVLILWLLGNLYVSSLDPMPKQGFSFYRKNPFEAVKWTVTTYGQNNLYHVYADLFSGRASDFRKTMQEREEKIKNYKSGILCLPKVKRIPKSIFYKDLFEDHLKLENISFAEYYNIEKVAVCEN